MTVCFELKPTSTFFSTFSSSFFFLFSQPAIVDFVNCEQCICVLFTIPQITLFSNFFIKNGSHNTIYTFKNYFTTMFSVSVFNFSKNKLNPNTPIVMRNWLPYYFSWWVFKWRLDSMFMSCICVFCFFFLLESWLLTFLCEQCTPMGLVHYSRDPQTLLFSNFFIKNGSHGTIHTFKNYFATVFSIFSF